MRYNKTTLQKIHYWKYHLIYSLPLLVLVIRELTGYINWYTEWQKFRTWTKHLFVDLFGCYQLINFLLWSLERRWARLFQPFFFLDSGQTRARMFPTETASYKRAIFFYFSALRSIVYTVTENVSFVLRMCMGNVITVIQGLAYNALRFRWISFLFIFVFDCCEVLSLFNILFKTKPVSFRLTDSRDIPLLDTRDYSSNWQNKVLER